MPLYATKILPWTKDNKWSNKQMLWMSMNNDYKARVKWDL